jgi:hypothetical protein
MTTLRPINAQIIWADEVETVNGARILLPAQLRWYQAFMTHEAPMNALFAYCWSVMARLHPHNKDAYYRSAVIHEMQGSNALQSLLATGNDLDAALKASLTLAATAVWMSRFDVFFVHLNGLERVVIASGGLSRLHWLTRECVVFQIVRVATNTRTRTILDPVSWDPGSWSERSVVEAVPDQNLDFELRPQYLLARKGFDAPQVSVEFPEIFEAVRELIEVEALRRRLAQDDPQVNRIFRWSQLRRQAVRARIQNLWCDITDLSHAVDLPQSTVPMPTIVHHANIDMCVCLALHIFFAFGLEGVLMRQDWVSTIAVWHVMLVRCIHKLGFAIERMNRSQVEASDALWICAIGAYVEETWLSKVIRERPTFWTIYDPNEVDRRLFCARFGVLARRLGYLVYEEVATMLEKRYVHVPALQDPVLSRLFNFEW